MRYSFFVGSTTQHSAHDHVDNTLLEAYLLRTHVFDAPVLTFGVWEGETEATAIYSAELSDDATAQRVAYAMAVLTGNAVVMVVRDTTDRDTYQSLNSTMRYRASIAYTCDGNRTISHPSNVVDGVPMWGSLGYAYESDPTGPEIVFLVGLDATVSPL